LAIQSYDFGDGYFQKRVMCIEFNIYVSTTIAGSISLLVD